MPDDRSDLLAAETGEGRHHPARAPFTQGQAQVFITGNSKKVLKIQRYSNAPITIPAVTDRTMALVKHGTIRRLSKTGLWRQSGNNNGKY